MTDPAIVDFVKNAKFYKIIIIISKTLQNKKTGGYSYRIWPLNPKEKVQTKKFFGIKLQLYRRWNYIEIFVMVQLLDSLTNFLQKTLIILIEFTDYMRVLTTRGHLWNTSPKVKWWRWWCSWNSYFPNRNLDWKVEFVIFFTSETSEKSLQRDLNSPILRLG